jgi:hypothetical protein
MVSDMNRSGERLFAGIAASLLAAGLVGCSSAAAPTPTMEPTAAPANDSSSARWLAVGDDIRRLSKNVPLLSEPLDINGAGTYTLYSGPVTEPMELPNGFSAPPDSSALDLRPAMPVSSAFVLRGGKRYVETTIEVRSPTASYRGLRLWLQASRPPSGVQRATGTAG